MASPTKGVERLAEELKAERTKANNALQERAKLRIEVETLNDTISHQLVDINELRNLLEEANNRLHEGNYEVESLQTSERNLSAELQNKAAENKGLTNELNTLRSENESMKKALDSKDSEFLSLKLRCENLEIRAAGREEAVEKLNFEIQQMRRDQHEQEQKNLESYQKLLDTTEMNEQLKSRISYLEIADKSYEDLKIATIQMRSSFENEISKNEMLNLDIRMLNQKLDEKASYITRLEVGGNELMADRENLMLKIQSLEFALEQQLSHIDAEVQASTAAREQAEAVTKGREILVLQIRELREAHQEALTQNTQLELKLASCNGAISQLQADLSSARDRMMEYQAEIERCAGMEVVASEVDNLRIQLASVKKQLARRDVEEETGSFVPKAVLERENSTRQVYEGVVADLRNEIEKLNNQKHDLSRKYEDARRQAARVEQLEEEIQLYKELAKNITLENQSAAQIVSESQERNLRSAQDNNSLMHNLHRVQTELESSRLEVQTYMKDNTKLRETMKEFHTAKIAADRKSADLHVVNSKLEMQMEEQRQKCEAAIIAAEKAAFQVNELKNAVADLQLKEKELTVLRGEYTALNSKMIGIKTASSGREKELYQEVELLRQTKATSAREITALNEKVVIQRQQIETSTAEISKLRSEIDSLNTEKDRYKREVAHNESVRTELQLSELRKDLESTVTEWQGLEKEKALKDKIIAQQQADLNKEKEKASLQKMQMSLLEDRLRTAGQELNVFRSIDLYHSSMQVELESYRKEKSHQQARDEAAAAGLPLGGHAAITPFGKTASAAAAPQVSNGLLSSANRGRQMTLADMDNSRQYLARSQSAANGNNKRPYQRDADLVSDTDSVYDHPLEESDFPPARGAPSAASHVTPYRGNNPYAAAAANQAAAAEERERVATAEARNMRLAARQLQLREQLLSSTQKPKGPAGLSAPQYVNFLKDDGNSLNSEPVNSFSRVYPESASKAPAPRTSTSHLSSSTGYQRPTSRTQGRPESTTPARTSDRSPARAGGASSFADAGHKDRFNVSPGTVRNAALSLNSSVKSNNQMLEAFRPSKVDYDKARKLLQK